MPKAIVNGITREVPVQRPNKPSKPMKPETSFAIAITLLVFGTVVVPAVTRLLQAAYH